MEDGGNEEDEEEEGVDGYCFLHFLLLELSSPFLGFAWGGVLDDLFFLLFGDCFALRLLEIALLFKFERAVFHAMSQPRVTVTVGQGGQRSATISSGKLYTDYQGGRKRSVKDRLGSSSTLVSRNGRSMSSKRYTFMVPSRLI
ncbi:hypothetical protein L7F22_021047 [Adiantum nelumboides]|nr:hypothetical protein [Adiantum nelumboides]